MEILKIHTRKMPLADDVDMDDLALDEKEILEVTGLPPAPALDDEPVKDAGTAAGPGPDTATKR